MGKGKKWVPTGKKYARRVKWRWRKVTKIKKGLLYRLRKMYVYSRRAKKWFRTRRFSWRRIKRKERSGYPQGRSMRDVSSGVGGKLTKRRSDTCSACVSCIRITKKERSGYAHTVSTGHLSSGGGGKSPKSRRVSCTACVKCMCTAEEQRSGSAQGGSAGVA